MESDFVHPYDGTTRCTDLGVLEGMWTQERVEVFPDSFHKLINELKSP